MNIQIKGIIYAALGLLAPWGDFLSGGQELTTRSVTATCVASLVGGLIAYKAWLSESPNIDK